MLNAPLSTDILPEIRLFLKVFCEFFDLIRRGPDCKNEIVIVLHVVLVNWPDIMIRLKPIIFSINLSSGKLVSLSGRGWINLWISSENVASSYLMTEEAVLPIIRDQSPPDSVDVGRSI